MTTRPPTPAGLDECDRIVDGIDADLAEAERDIAGTRTLNRHLRAKLAMCRAAHALPSDDMIEDLIRARAAVVYARHRSERDVVALQRVRRLLWPGWWRRLLAWLRT